MTETSQAVISMKASPNPIRNRGLRPYIHGDYPQHDGAALEMPPRASFARRRFGPMAELAATVRGRRHNLKEESSRLEIRSKDGAVQSLGSH